MPSAVRKSRSLIMLLIGFIACSVAVILTVKTLYIYEFYQSWVEERVQAETTISLRKLGEAVTPYIQSFSINEYEKLISTEMGANRYLAILVSNDQFAEMTGKDDFVSGFIRSPEGETLRFQPEEPMHLSWLQTAYSNQSLSLYNFHDQLIGSIAIYSTNDEVKRWLSPIIYHSVFSSLLVLFSIIGFVAFIVVFLLLKPLNKLSQTLSDRDADGIPTQAIGLSSFRELSTLTGTINTMLQVVKESRDSLQTERDRFQQVIEGTRVGTWEWNVQTGEVIFNDRWAEIIGYSLEELAPISIDTWMKVANPEDLVQSSQLLDKHFNGELPYYECEARMRHKDGHWVWVMDRGRVFSWTDDGKPLWMSGTHQEITERKHNEAALSASEERYRHLSELSPSALWQSDSQGNLTYVSQHWVDITGISFEECCQGSWLDSVHPYDFNRVSDEWQLTCQGATSYQSEYRVKKPDGSIVWVLCIANWVKDEKEDGASWIGTITDITELKRTEDQLQEATIKAESANIAKSRFLATMSHEIRTPMNGIMGLAQLLEGDELIEETRKNYAKTIMKSGQSLLALLNDILDISKVESGKLRLEERELVPNEVTTDITRLFADSARRNNLNLIVDLDESLKHRYIGDPHRISQMLANLVNNAIKFSSSGVVTISAKEVGSSGSHSTIEFSVEDKGIGIAAEKLPTIFEPFSQSDNTTTRKYGGTGLGLSIVKGLSRLMEGDVGVVSTEGKGSCFWFQVRVKNAIADTKESPSTELGQDSSSKAPAEKQTGKILVAEDDRTNQMVVRAMLKKLGFEIIVANNGREAVHLVTDHHEEFDAILMDVNMPVMDGHSATRAIRKWEQQQQQSPTPIIALTADAFPEDREKCQDAGMDDFLTKPIIVEQLSSTLKNYI